MNALQVSELMSDMDIQLQKAIQAQLLAEVVYTAMQCFRDDKNLGFDEAIRMGLQEWDILSKDEIDLLAYGATRKYKIGDVVVWGGHTPCIGRISAKDSAWDHCYAISKSHNSLHYSNLRYATPEEIEALGDKNILLI